MHLDFRHNGDCILVRFTRICNLNNTNTEKFKNQVLEAAKPGKTVIVNFENLEFIDSAGLTLLIYLRKKILEKGGQFKLANVVERILKLLQITRLHRVLDIFESVEEAVKSLNIRERNPREDHPYRLHIQVKHGDNYSLIKIVQPDALVSANCRSLMEKVLQYLENSNAAIINFDLIRNIDSTGIASLLKMNKLAQERKKTITLVYSNTVLDRLFKLYSIENLFPQYKSNRQAIASLKPPSQEPDSLSHSKAVVQTLDRELTFEKEEFEDIHFLETHRK